METDNDQKLFFPSDVVSINIKGTYGSYKIAIPKKEMPTVGEIFENNEYAVQGPRLRSGPMKVVDIGANIGLFSIYMKFQDPDCTIDCFDPSPSTLTLLQANTGHIPGITIHPYGLYNKDDEVEPGKHGSAREKSVTPVARRVSWGSRGCSRSRTSDRRRPAAAPAWYPCHSSAGSRGLLWCRPP